MAHAEHNTYLSGYTANAVKHHEWRTAENSAAYLLPFLSQMESSKSNLKLLDVGAGSGTLTASLAKYMPNGHVTATDINEDILKKAEEHAEAVGAKNVHFQVANVYKLPFADNSFDIAHAHTVLGHLDDPVAAIREMLRVVRKGGIVALRESDLRMWSIWPEYPEMKAFNEMLCKVSASNGAFINAGARLVSWALEAEPRLEREQITASAGTWCYSSPEERKLWGETLANRCVNGDVPKKAVESGICTREDQQRMAEAWLKWMNAKDGWFGCMHGEVVVRHEISR